jgi:hypothetical protein
VPPVTPPIIPPIPPVIPPPPAPGPYTPIELKHSGADILRMHSGQIASAVLPSINRADTNSGQVIFGESTVAPRNAIIEIAISRTQGLIDPNSGDFYSRTENASFMKKEWLERPVTSWGARNDEIAAVYHLAKAYLDQGPWYVNVRYTYAPGDCQFAPCGFVNQWNYGGF